MQTDLYDLGWRTPDTYVSKFCERIPKKSGLYLFLHTDGNYFDGITKQLVMYVGRSKNLYNRIRTHDVLPKIPVYTQTWFLPLDYDMTRFQEIRHIRKYNPPYNVIHKKVVF